MGRFYSSWWISFCLLPLLAVPLEVSSDEVENVFSKASCDFALDLLKSQSKSLSGNIIASPSSIAALLSVIQQGAKEETLKQLDTVLHLTAEQSRAGQSVVLKSLQREKRNVTLEMGNKAYIRPGFDIDEAFNTTVTEHFGASFEEINFVEPSTEAAAATINSWVSDVTHDNIKNFISSGDIGPGTLLILLNAIFFKGLWDVPFKKSDTKEEAFEISPNNTVTVPFMNQNERFLAGEDPENKVKWVDLPFKDEQFSMLFLLPTEKHGLEELIEKLNGELLLKIINDDQSRSVSLQIPKFKLKKKVSLSKPLEELGLKDIFTEAANLQGITQHANLKVSKIIHEAGIEIDEIGGVAYAATGTVFLSFNSPVPDDRITFRADHPFLFFLLDRTNKLPLFSGRVADPS